jgi:hypothetical protein
LTYVLWVLIITDNDYGVSLGKGYKERGEKWLRVFIDGFIKANKVI